MNDLHTDRLGRLVPMQVRDLVETARLETSHQRVKRVTARQMETWSQRHTVPPAPHTIRRWRHRWFAYGALAGVGVFAAAYCMAAYLFVWVLGGGA